MKAEYLEQKRSFANFNIFIKDNGQDISNSIYIGRAFGLFSGADLICSFPMYPKNHSHFQDYKDSLRLLLAEYGDVKKIAIYQCNFTRKYFALRLSNRAKYCLTSRLNSLINGMMYDLELPHSAINMYFEDETERHSIGSVFLNRDKFEFIPIICFNNDLFTQEVKIACVPICSFLGDGDYTEGYWYTSNEEGSRELLLKIFPKQRAYGRQIKKISYHYDKQVERTKEALKLFSKECYLINGRMVKKTLIIGDSINFDWFGQEHGFFLNGDQGQLLRFIPDSTSNKEILKAYEVHSLG